MKKYLGKMVQRSKVLSFESQVVALRSNLVWYCASMI